MNPKGESPALSAPAVGDRLAEGPPTADTLDRLAGRALVFQAYLLRRAWGVYYAIWSAALVGFFVVPGVLAGPLSHASTAEVVAYYVYLALLIGAAIGATSWAFAQSARAVRLRDTLEGRQLSRRRFLEVLAIGVAITALVVVVSFVSSFAGLLVLDAVLGGVTLWLLIQVRAWFRPVPPEATIAVATYAASVLGSAFTLVLTGEQIVYSACWLVAVGGWAFAGFYALYHAPEEMAGAAVE